MNTSSLKDLVRRARIRALRLRMRRLPELPITNGQVLIVAPHPDDETLGCGGLIARLCNANRPPHVVILTRGEGSHRGCCNLSDDEIANARHQLTLKSAEILGLPPENIHSLDIPDGNIPHLAENLPKTLSNILEELDPQTLFLPHWGEGWPDHLNARNTMLELVSAHNRVEHRTEVFEYCVWMWYYMVRGLDWKNAFALRMSPGEFERKRAAAAAYVNPKAPCGTPWSGLLPTPFLEATTLPTELYFQLP